MRRILCFIGFHDTIVESKELIHHDQVRNIRYYRVTEKCKRCGAIWCYPEYKFN